MIAPSRPRRRRKPAPASPRPKFTLIARGVRHPTRPVVRDLLKFPDGHYSIRHTFAIVGTFHSVPVSFGLGVEHARMGRKGARHGNR